MASKPAHVEIFMHKRFALSLLCSFFLALPAFSQDIDWNKVIEVVQNFTEALNRVGNEAEEASAIADKYYNFINATWPTLEGHIADLSDLPAAIRHAGDAAQACFFVLSVCIIAASFICIMPQITQNCRRHSTFGTD